MKKVAETLVDAVELTIDGEVYRMVYDFAAIRAAEAMINRQLGAGEKKVNLLSGFYVEDIDARQLHALFYAALVRDRPEIRPADVDRLIRFDTWQAIKNGLLSTWASAMPAEAQERLRKILADPTEDGGEKRLPSEADPRSGNNTGPPPSSSSESPSGTSGG